MRITDPLWPAVREVARMLLREDNLTIVVSNGDLDQVNKLVLAMGDHQPDRLTFPKTMVSSSESFSIVKSIDGETTLLVQSGPSPPDVEIVWLPLEANQAWKDVNHAAEDLLRAGYPGCLGCGGPNSEQPWDEGYQRAQRRTLQ